MTGLAYWPVQPTERPSRLAPSRLVRAHPKWMILFAAGVKNLASRAVNRVSLWLEERISTPGALRGDD
jgi:hypothetical protein